MECRFLLVCNHGFVENAEIELLGLFKNSLQGDAAGAKLFAQLGVGTAFTDRGVVLKYNGNAVKKLIYNFVNDPIWRKHLLSPACY